MPSFRRSILTHDRAALTAAGLFKSAQRTQSTQVVVSADQDFPCGRESEVPAHRGQTWGKFSISIKVSHAAVLGTRQHKMEAHQHARQSHLGKLAGAAQF